jgi:hypothetical protein
MTRVPDPKDLKSREDFDAWFEGSRVRTHDKKPLLVYHGAGERRSVFEPRESKRFAAIGGFRSEYAVPSSASFFTDDRKFAASFGPEVTEVYLRIVRPLDLTEGICVNDQDAYDILAAHFGGESPCFTPPHECWEFLDHPEVVKQIRALGYDGVMLMERDNTGTAFDTFAVFDSNQVVCADHPCLRAAATEMRRQKMR